MVERGGSDDPLPRGTQRIEVHVGELKQLFNAMDPAPFRERDLDPNAEQFIVNWARELHRDAPLALVVQLSRETPTPEGAAVLEQAVHEYFGHAAQEARARLKRLFATGRWALAIGLAFVAAANVVGDLVAHLVGEHAYGRFLHESIVIGAWVALWRPMEIFLYDWWPILGDARLFDRLAAMPVRLVASDGAAREGRS